MGGQAVQASSILTGLQREAGVHVDFFLIGPRAGGWLAPLFEIRYLRTAASVVLFIARLLRVGRRYEIFHVFSAGLWSFNLWTVPAVHIGRLLGVSVIVNYHDGRAEQHLARFPRSARWTLRRASRIVTPSGYLVDVFARRGLRAQSIFNVIDLSRFRFRARGKLRPVLMTNRMLDSLYNVECVLRSFQIIQREYPDATLTVAHDGPCRTQLEAYARELNLQGVRFIGIIPHDRAPVLYDEADIYVMSPNIDNMPVSILECYASGLPVISTEAGGVPYIATNGQTALLVPLDDHEAMARCCLTLLADENLAARLASNGRAELCQYQWSSVGREWLALYRELARPELASACSSLEPAGAAVESGEVPIKRRVDLRRAARAGAVSGATAGLRAEPPRSSCEPPEQPKP